MFNRDTTHASGWDWIDRGYGELQFFGDACASAASGTTRVVAVVSCPDH